MKLGSVLEQKETIFTKVKKMHVLVHPGYEYGDDRIGSASRNVLEAEALFQKYKEIAKNISPDEIMVILVHNKPKIFREHKGHGKTYTKNIDSIVENFSNKRQAIVLTSETVPFSGLEKESDNFALDKVRSILKQRGYEINPNTEVEVFGEMAGECVMEAFYGIKNTDFFKEVHTKKLI
jgi:hypothetical protein